MPTSLSIVGPDIVDLLLIVARQLADILGFGDLSMLTLNKGNICGRLGARQADATYETDCTRSESKVEL